VFLPWRRPSGVGAVFPRALVRSSAWHTDAAVRSQCASLCREAASLRRAAIKTWRACCEVESTLMWMSPTTAALTPLLTTEPEAKPQPRPTDRVARTASWTLPVLASCWFLGAYRWVACSRVAYPYEFESMEGSMVDHVRRLFAGQPLYVGPSLEFVPFIYTPLFYGVSLPFVSAMGSCRRATSSCKGSTGHPARAQLARAGAERFLASARLF
jgi:hypothetical protein